MKIRLLTVGGINTVMIVNGMVVILAEVLVLQVLAFTRTALVDLYVQYRNQMELLKQKKERGRSITNLSVYNV